MNYSEQLKSPKWQKKRLEIMQRDSFRCVNCKDENSTLHVHHKSYDTNKMAWEYEDSNFMTLCESCHKLEHDKIEILEDGGLISCKDVINRIPDLNKYFIEISNHKGCWQLKIRDEKFQYEAFCTLFVLIGYAWFDCQYELFDSKGINICIIDGYKLKTTDKIFEDFYPNVFMLVGQNIYNMFEGVNHEHN